MMMELPFFSSLLLTLDQMNPIYKINFLSWLSKNKSCFMCDDKSLFFLIKHDKHMPFLIIWIGFWLLYNMSKIVFLVPWISNKTYVLWIENAKEITTY